VTASSPSSHSRKAPALVGGARAGARGNQCMHHERDGPLLCPAAHRTMLKPYARNFVYLIVGPLYGSVRSYRVQVGGRERCHSLQRSTARECAEGNASPAADLQGTEATSGTAFGGGSSQGGPVSLQQLRDSSAGKRGHVSERDLRGCRGGDEPRSAAWRRGRSAARWLESCQLPAGRWHHNGQVVCQTTNVTFTVLQPSVLNPANPNFHR
jgi:hypothetical protein